MPKMRKCPQNPAFKRKKTLPPDKNSLRHFAPPETPFYAAVLELELSSEALKVNESIYEMGDSVGDEFSVMKGTIFSIYENVSYFAEQSFKDSGLKVGEARGSSVFDEKGKVINIIYGGKFASGVALPIRYVKIVLEALQQNKYP